MSQPREVVLIGHDMSENGYSSQIQKLVTSIYSKRPNSDVYSIDWSELVSFLHNWCFNFKTLQILSRLF